MGGLQRQRSLVLQVRMTPFEMEQAQGLARRRGVSLPELVRQGLVAASLREESGRVEDVAAANRGLGAARLRDQMRPSEREFRPLSKGDQAKGRRER